MHVTFQKTVEAALQGEKVGFETYLANAREELKRGVKEIGPIEDIAIVKHHRDDRWLMLLPDVSGGDHWRTQSFDRNGFSGHSVFASKNDAVREAASMNFTVRDDAALDRIQDSCDFQTGLFATEQIVRLNTGQIGFEEYLRSVSNFRKRLDVASRTIA